MQAVLETSTRKATAKGSFIGMGAPIWALGCLQKAIARCDGARLPDAFGEAAQLEKLNFWTLPESNNGNLRGDVSERYLNWPTARIAWLKEVQPDLRIVLVEGSRRDSAWAVVAREAGELALEPHEVSDEWIIGRLERPECRAWCLVNESISRWRQFFGRDAILVVSVEELAKSTRAVLSTIGRHIGSELDAGPLDETENIPSPDWPVRDSLNDYLDVLWGNGCTSVAPFPRDARSGVPQMLQTKSYLRHFGREWFVAGERRRLHLGCGSNVLPGWLNTDCAEHLETGVMRLEPPFPLFLPDASFDVVYLSPWLNRLTASEGTNLVMDCHRILRKNGRLRLCVFNPHFLAKLYAGADEQEINRFVVWYTEAFMPNCELYSKSLVAGRVARSEECTSLYDEEMLSYMLETAGFSGISRKTFGQSECEDLVGVEDSDGLPAGLAPHKYMIIEAVKS